jgi:eukaryotic-like serine/threonine-protein kinase
MGQPASGRSLVKRSLQLQVELRDTRGHAQGLVVLGEIDYLLGEHARASEVLTRAERDCAAAGDELGRAQALILLAMIQTSVGGYAEAVDLLVEARGAFDQMGYRLGIAQCDVVLGHADHRARKFPMAWARAETARVAFRELVNPRGEAASERLLSMIALDTERYSEAQSHAEVAARIFEKLNDPWGDLETRLLVAQVALATGAPNAGDIVAQCDAIALDEAEPRQHRHLTRAWLFQTRELWSQAATELEAARATFAEHTRSGDHTPHLLQRFAGLVWKEAAEPQLAAWLSHIEAQDHSVPVSSQWPLRGS